METCRNVRRVTLSAEARGICGGIALTALNMATVSLKNVKKICYDNKVTAVHDFNLEIADKEFIVLVSLRARQVHPLRMIAGLEDISEAIWSSAASG